MGRRSDTDTDAVVWQEAPLRLGTSGLDLRRPSEPPALADLLNARFLDEATIRRRDGHTGQEVRDGDAFPPGPLDPEPSNWVYGHGHTAGGPAQNTHYPVHLRGAATFRFGAADVVWTGDRLLIPQSNGNAALGSSSFWQRIPDLVAGDASTKTYPRGIPAHLPLEVDSTAPAAVGGDYVESCLTPTLRVYVNIRSGVVTVTTIDRATGAIIDVTDITSSATTAVEPTVVNSGGVPVVIFRDSTQLVLHTRYWNGSAWSPDNSLVDTVAAYDVALTSTGFYLVWRTGSTIKVGEYVGGSATAQSILFGTALGIHETPGGEVAAAMAPNKRFGVAYLVAGTPDAVAFEEFSSAGGYRFRIPSTTVGMSLSAAGALRGLSVVSRGLTDASGNYEWVMHRGDTNGGVTINSFSSTNAITNNGVGGGKDGLSSHVRYNSDLISRSFSVGDEVFAWLRSRTSGSVFQLAGSLHPYVCGTADREVGLTPIDPAGGAVYWTARVWPDPNDTTNVTRTWTRRFNTNDDAREGNVLTGYIDYLPQLSIAEYGKSLYLSGSCVKNWDGQVLADAGFYDYPKISTVTPQIGGGLAALGTYRWLARAVRYNGQGERFESTALITSATTLTGSNQSAQITVLVPPGVSTDDVIVEIYRTENGGVAYYREGVVAAPYTAETVSFTSTMTDATLRLKYADPHQTGVDGLEVIDGEAPLGCAFLAVVGDRLWGGGGQVPLGELQFSLLKSAGFGVGFDIEAGYYQVDNEGGGITSIAALDGATVAFEADRYYVISGAGPNNYGAGSYDAPEFVQAAGAVNHFGTVLTQLGVAYWGAEGPMLLTPGFKAQNISSPIRPLTATLIPVGVQIDTAKMEIVWHCGTQAVLWNYMAGSRWARWSLPDVVGCSAARLITSTGRLLTEQSEYTTGDDGVPFPFLFKSGNIRGSDLLEGAAAVQRAGLLGGFDGDHKVRMRMYYDGAAMWSDEFVWEPQTQTWLTKVEDVSGLTAAQVDAQGYLDQSGQYATHQRVARERCHYFSIEVSDIGSWEPTFTPFELSFVVAMRPGLGRTPVNSFTRS